MSENLKIGLIVKPQGVRGELKVQPLTDDFKRFSKLKEVIIDGKAVKVIKVRYGDNEVYLTLFGVNDRNSAELLRNKFLEVDRENAVKLPENRYYIVDLIGCELYFEDQPSFAVLTDVTSARTDVITAKTHDGKTVRFPFLLDAVIDVDVENKKIKIDKKRFKEIAVYED